MPRSKRAIETFPPGIHSGTQFPGAANHRGQTAVAASDNRVQRNLAHLGKITRELQELSMSMRMVPIHGVFQKMARLVRDLARKQGIGTELPI